MRNPHALPVHSDSDATDGDLVARAQEGDRHAFSELYRRYHRMARYVCLGVLRNPHLAEDAAHDAFINAFARIDSFIPGKEFGPWLRRIAINRCISIQRSLASAAAPRPVEPRDRSPDGPLDAVVRIEYERELVRAVASLPERQRKALLLYALDGWNYERIAELEGMSLSCVKSLIFRARHRLRELCDTPALLP